MNQGLDLVCFWLIFLPRMVLVQRTLIEWSLQVPGCSARAVSVDRCHVKGLWSNQMPACSLGPWW